MIDYAAVGTAIAGIFAGIAGYFSYQQRKDSKNGGEELVTEDQVKEIVSNELKEIQITTQFINKRLDAIDNKLDKVTDYLIDGSRPKAAIRRTHTEK